MSLTQALSTALAGLDASQASLSVISGNVANANTPGYVDESSTQVEESSGPNSGSSVVVTGVSRDLNTLLQSQLWTETSGGSYADTSSQLYQQLQQIYGTPGSSTSFDAIFNSFTSALQTLSTSPSSYSAQSGVVSAAQGMAQNLNTMTGSIQQLRTEAEQGIANDVQQANQAMQQIAQINSQLGSSTSPDGTTAVLEDQRDQAITQLSQLMNVNVVQGSNNQVSVFTGNGQQLVGEQAAQLDFNNAGTLSATSLYNSNPAQDGVGTITLVSPSGTSTDLIASNSIQAGQIAAYLNMRDTVLPQAQNQLDELASQMSQALSNQTTTGTAVTSGSQTGFSVGVSGLSAGNTVQITYTDASNTQHTVTLVNVTDPAALPLPSSLGTPTNPVIGVNFSGSMASVVSQLNTALGQNLQFSNPAGTTLQVLNPSFSNAVVVNSMSASATVTSLQSGNPQLPLFLDGTTPITGAITSSGTQTTGLAGSITVNSAVASDPGSLIAYSPTTAAGDSTRPNFLFNQLTNVSLTFPPTTGIGGPNAPFSSTLTNYMSQIVSQQSLAANAATSLQQGQDTVVTALQQRVNSQSGVSIDTEMTNLINLQNAYAANARVMTTIQQMMATLIQIGT
jgi:flagellar hook-associated protein 1